MRNFLGAVTIAKNHEDLTLSFSKSLKQNEYCLLLQRAECAIMFHETKRKYNSHWSKPNEANSRATAIYRPVRHWPYICLAPFVKDEVSAAAL